MKYENHNFFTITVSEKQVQLEKNRARILKHKQWWKSKVSKGVCFYCRNKVPEDEITMDHIVPIIRGGKSTKGNIVAACKICNNNKKYLLPCEWENYIKSLQNGEKNN